MEEILKCYIVFEFEGHVLGTINCYIQNTPFSIDRTCYDFVNGYFIRQRETFNKKICVIVGGWGGMNARVSCTGLSEVIPQPKLLFHHSIYFSYNTTICPRKINMCMHTVFYMYIELLRIKGIIRIREE